MKMSIQYCAARNYEPKAVSLADRILTTYKQKIEGLTMIPSGGGCFEVKVDDELVYSKLSTGQFPEPPEVLKEIEKRI